MKTTLKFWGVLILIFSLASCELDEIETTDPESPIAADAKAVKNYNNGMIKSYSHETVLEWNEFLGEFIDEAMPQPAEAKIYAMVTLAMHDALNNVVPIYETYALDNLEVDASDISKKNIQGIADAAVSQAARDMMAQLFPPSTTAADSLLTSTLSEIEDSDQKARGVAIGSAAATAVLEKRQQDFPFGFTAHVGGTAPGEYQSNFAPWMSASPNPPFWPANAVYAPNLGNLTPFGIESGDQFREEAPFALDTEEYLEDYNEVKALGCTSCPLRTDEQTEIGAFWVENTASSMNRLARQLIVKNGLNGWEAARLIGLIQMSQMDAFIASFEGKAYFNFWRPITAIRGGDADGIEATAGDISWTPTFTTPPTPDFPSTHAYNGGAAAAVFASYFKSDLVDITVSSPYYLPGVERHLNSFSQMAHENAVSRIYIGYHFRRAVEVGKTQGLELGEYVFQNNLRELKKLK